MDKNKNIAHVFSSLQSKVEKLILQHRKAVEELEQVKEDNVFLRESLATQKVRLSESEERNKVLKLSKSINEMGERNTDVKLKINELVREIDRCIAQVNN